MLDTNKLFIRAFLFLSLAFSGLSSICAASPVDSCDVISCNQDIFVSVNQGDQYAVSVDMLLEGKICRDRTYFIYYFDENDVKHDFNFIDDNLPQQFEYEVEDSKTGNKCWGTIHLVVKNCDRLNCLQSVFFSIYEGDTYPISLDQLLEGRYCYDHDFLIEYINENDDRVVLTALTDQMPSRFTYIVTDLTTDKSCEGEINIKVIDCDSPTNIKLDPTFVETTCLEDLSPEGIGFPVPSNVKVEERENEPGVYDVSRWHPCETFTLVYADHVIVYDCTEPYGQTIRRTWNLYDHLGNLYETTDTIRIRRIQLDEVTAPINYDGFSGPVLSCKDGWDVISNPPLPEITGSPLHGKECNYLAESSSDIIIHGNGNGCYDIDKILRTWTIIDWCSGNSKQIVQLIKIECANDKEAPQAFCASDLTIKLNLNDEAKLLPYQIDNGSMDDCGIARLAFNEDGSVNELNFDISHINQTQSITLWVTDFASNQSTCTTNVTIEENPGIDGNLGGRFRNYKLGARSKATEDLRYVVKNSTISQLPPNCKAPGTATDLHFSLCVDQTGFNGPYFLEVIPPVDDNVLDNVSVRGLIALMQILVSRDTQNPFLLRAADLNNDQSVSAADGAMLRGLILGTIDKVENYRQFYVADTVNIQRIEGYAIDNLPYHDLEIVEVIKGNLHDPDITGGFNSNSTRSPQSVVMYMEDREVSQGEIFDIWLSSEEEANIVGVQFGQIFDENALEVIDISAPSLEDTELWKGYAQDYRYVWVDDQLENKTIKENWLKVTFKSNVSAKMSDLVNEDDAPIRLLLVDDAFNEIEIDFEFRDATSTRSYVGNLSAIKVYPNPFSDKTILDFRQLEDREGLFHLYTTRGEHVMTRDLRELETSGQLELNAESLPQSGLYIGVAETSSGRHIVKFSKL